MKYDPAFAATLKFARASAVGPLRARTLLGAQVSVLDEIFHELARRSVGDLEDYNSIGQRVLSLAFKAQLQSRSALTSLAKIQELSPPPVRRAPSAEKSGIETNEPVEAQHGERLEP